MWSRLKGEWETIRSNEHLCQAPVLQIIPKTARLGGNIIRVVVSRKEEYGERTSPKSNMILSKEWEN
jgi:hypothetical protein